MGRRALTVVVRPLAAGLSVAIGLTDVDAGDPDAFVPAMSDAVHTQRSLTRSLLRCLQM